MKTPNEIFEMFATIAKESKENIIALMREHNINSLNTFTYMNDYGFDYVDISVYDRKLDGTFYEPITQIVLDEEGIHLFYDGESSGECYEPTTTDWANVYSLVYDIFLAVDKGEIEIFTEME